MIKAKDAIQTARSMIGTPYAEIDCINLIKAVIRRTDGGVQGYTTAGTNALWNSYGMTAKYKDLTWRQEGLAGARAGMIAFKADGADYHHAGIVTGEGTVIHASSVYGRTVETPLTDKEGWTHIAIHRYIKTEEEERMESYKARVSLKDEGSSLNVRNAPGKNGDVIGKLRHGAVFTVQAAVGDWLYGAYGDSGSGYVSAQYLQRIEDAPQEEAPVIVIGGAVTITDDAGNMFTPQGGWRVTFAADDSKD